MTEAAVDSATESDEGGCLCCGQPLPERVGARGGPRLRYCPEGAGRWDDGTFSCKRHGAAVVTYRTARGDGVAEDPLVVVEHHLTRLQDLLAPVSVALADTGAVLRGQEEIVRAESRRVAEADAHAEHARRRADTAETAQATAETTAAQARETANRACAERDDALARAESDRARAGESEQRAVTAEQARRDAVAAATDAVKTREAIAARADQQAHDLRRAADEHERLTRALAESRAETHAATTDRDLARHRADDLTTRLDTLTTAHDTVTHAHAETGTELAVARATADTLTATVTRQSAELADLRRAHHDSTARLRTLTHLATTLAADAPPAVRSLLTALTEHPDQDLLTDLTTHLADAEPDTRAEVVLTRLHAHGALAAIPDPARLHATLRSGPTARDVLVDLAATGHLAPPTTTPATHDPATPAAPDTTTLRTRTPDTHPAPDLATRVLRAETARSTHATIADTGPTLEIRVTANDPLADYLTALATRLGLTTTTD
ncbi:hypothetical protein [Actinokineospora enzanensis]|uniref:hypothetical protein n=1 Tax=Actinokineospora enzanensis TaxID=155975 RepID=UPI0012EC6AAA|nr:hypothetical protein [Actinokineospora enzanensis]